MKDISQKGADSERVAGTQEPFTIGSFLQEIQFGIAVKSNRL